MAKKEFTYRGKSLEDLQKLSITEFAELIPARARRSLKRGFNEKEQTVLRKIRAGKDNLKTHCRTLVILPEMIGKTISIYDGRKFEKVILTEEMLGHTLGEFTYNRKKVSHSAPGIGATKSSSAMSVK